MRANKTLRYHAARIKKLPDLSAREKDILVSRLMNNTLEKIGKRYSVTAERIRQIELQAIKKIKNRANQLQLFNDE